MLKNEFFIEDRESPATPGAFLPGKNIWERKQDENYSGRI
jgi:hypothetical protein